MIPDGWRCTKRVGFLFPHPCERMTPVGCPDCQNGQIQDPYCRRTDRYGYSGDDFDAYDSTEMGALAMGALAFGGGDSGGAGASADFSEADGESLVAGDDNFEDDLSAS
jgi:hypothetical protein